jgi:hydroxyacylglutathione hydrolase
MPGGAVARIERLVVGRLATNCYVLESEGEIAVVDPGGDGDRILAKVEEMEGAVRYVINTHGHVDHVAANRAVLEAAGEEAGLLIHEADAEYLAQPDISFAMMVGQRIEAMSPTRTLVEGDEVCVGDQKLVVWHTPGHTPGGICLVGSGYAFTGDTLFVDSIGRTDLPGGSEPEMRASLLRLQSSLAPETMLYPGHNEPGTLSRARLANPFLGTGWLS